MNPQTTGERMNNNVTIIDIKMPFISMVIFMVKAAIASIPAMIILSIIGSIIFAVLGFTFGSGNVTNMHFSQP
jgi:hypothetical protein